MYSYFAVISNERPGSTEFCLQKIAEIRKLYPSYTKSLFNNGSYIITSEDEVDICSHEFDGGKGVIIGTLFRKSSRGEGAVVRGDIDYRETEKIIISRGRHIIENYWGKYVAFISFNDGNVNSIMRDPTGGFDCYFFNHELGLFVFSDARQFAMLRLTSLTFNAIHIACHIKFPLSEFADTGLNEIDKVLPGEILEIKAQDVRRSFYWQPNDFCEGDRYEDPREAAKELSNVVMNTAHAWAARYPRIIHHLSGGLDSTILLSCLKSAPTCPEVTCLNIYWPGIDSDERDLARNAAGSIGAPLIEHLCEVEKSDISIIREFEYSAEPVMSRYQLVHGAVDKNLEREIGADVIFTGEGGDCVFYQGSDYCIDDYVHNNGINLGLLKQALYAARVHRGNYWSFLTSAIWNRYFPRHWSIGGYWDKIDPEISPLSLDFITKVDADMRSLYWLGGLSKQSIAKKNHVYRTRFKHSYFQPNSPRYQTRMCFPLLSQPIFEVCFRIPAYMFCWNGVDRGLVRMAFSELAPRRNILRQSKGGASDFYDRVMEKNLPFLREYILDGLLTSYGIFDRRKVERGLADGHSQGRLMRLALLEAAGTEAWMRQWVKLL